MKILLVTGVSGAGKSLAVDVLEDFGYYCIDNLPPQAAATFIDLCKTSEVEKLALVTDIRADVFKNTDLSELIDLRERDPEVKILYLEADDETLIKRYQETRRNHPLQSETGTLEEALKKEKEWLKPLRDASDGVIDTTDLKVAGLREKIQEILQTPEGEISIHVSAFGYKYGVLKSADFVFDTRFLPNPFYLPELRNMTGLDKPVRDYVMENEEARKYLEGIEKLIESILPYYVKIGKLQLSVAFGCTGGQHRSVTFAFLFERYFRELGYKTVLNTRDIFKDRTIR